MKDNEGNDALPVGTTAVRFGGIRYHVPVWVTACPKIFPAMIAANKAIEAVAKSRKNAQQQYNFRGIDQVYDMIHGVLADAGIVTIPVVLQRKTSEQATKSGGSMALVEMKIEYWCYADDGSALVIGPLWSEALDMSDKATNKALAFAQKYALLQTFTIPTSDVSEGDRETNERGAPPSQQQGSPREQAQQAQVIGAVLGAKIVAAFGELGVTPDMLKAKIGTTVADAPFGMRERLADWRDQLASKKASVVSIFGASGTTDRAAALNDKLKNGPPEGSKAPQ